MSNRRHGFTICKCHLFLLDMKNDNETKLTEKSPHCPISPALAYNDIPLTGYYIAIKWQLWKECTVVVDSYDEMLVI